MNTRRSLTTNLSRRLLCLLLFVGFLALGLPMRAHGQALITASAFLGDCSGVIIVTQDTRVSGRATVAKSCEIALEPGVTLEFLNAILNVNELSITDADAILHVANSRLEALKGALDVDLSGDASTVSLTESILIAATDLALTAAQVSATSSQLTAGAFLDVFSLSGEVALNNSRLTATREDLLVDAATTATVTASTLTARSFVEVGALLETVTLKDSRVTASNGDIGIFGETQTTVTGTVLTASDFLDILAFTGAVVLNKDSRLTATDILVHGETQTTVAASVLTAGLTMNLGAFGATQVQTSKFTGLELNIFSDDSTTAASLNNFVGVKGLLEITGAGGCTSTRNVPDTPCS
ncbi:MAG: hypothetical protein AB7P69_19170 [Candidatus Binatia bacterium]